MIRRISNTTLTTLFFVFFSLWCYSQGNKGVKDVVGTYKYSVQEIKNSAAYYTRIIQVKRNKTYQCEEGSHILGGTSEENGTWRISGDTLILTSSDTIIDKYLISTKRICEIEVAGEKIDSNGICLEKK